MIEQKEAWKEWLQELPDGGYEGIIITINADTGRNNAAAAGVEWNGKDFLMHFYRGSNTFQFLSRRNKFGLCFYPSDDVIPLLRASLYGYGNKDEEFPPEEYCPVGDAQVLAKAPICFCCSVEEKTPEEVKDDVGENTIMRLVSKPISGHGGKDAFEPPRKSQHPILIAAAAYTRALYLTTTGDKEKSRVWKSRGDALLESVEAMEREKALIRASLGAFI